MDNNEKKANQAHNNRLIQEFLSFDEGNAQYEFSNFILFLMECYINYDIEANFTPDHKREIVQRFQMLNKLAGGLKAVE
jgi:hypothetical protein